MSTQAISIHHPSVSSTHVKSDTTQFWKDMEFNRYGIMAMLLILQSCIGSIGAMYALQIDGALSIVLLSTVAAVNMGANSLCIALAPMKVIIWSGVATVAVSILAIVLGLAMG